MSYRTDTVAIIGLGLIGGSLARALRGAGFGQRYIAYGPREPSLKRGLELGIIDAYTLDLDELLAQADIVVLCSPTRIAEQTLRDILPSLVEQADPPVITDAASVKGNLLRAARDACCTEPPFLVLGHPIAGSEQSGVAASDADLYRDHRVILTPTPAVDAEALAVVDAMWRATGAEVVQMEVETHDAVLAATSHLPHALAYALVDALAQSEQGEEIFRFAAGGFRDFTRIASSDPVMWRDIALANREALLASLDGFSEHLARMRDAIDRGDGEELHQTFTRAKAARDHFAALLAARTSAS